jgi:hypothetical protein
MKIEAVAAANAADRCLSYFGLVRPVGRAGAGPRE